ncbi:uncharacterized protein LOC132330235 [Haemorhous mexicanus]|uniref:uncharacterized protein LOC132330235 n=1 Tax=Haemorhous mexicanus TaxID=30427 RepID=UPI0028BEAE94|nr:uncharacterized protein LOC132330235 [Haemorhous mexicanus]
MSEWHFAILLHSPQLFVALLLQIVTITEQTAEDAETRSFWRACQEEHGLPGNPSSFAAQTMKALLSTLGFDKKLMALEDKRVWQKLLCAPTQHYAAALLAREVRRALAPLCPFMASHLLGLLIGKQPRCPLPALAFFQLADPDAEMVGMTLCVLTCVLQDKDLVLPSVIALKLAEPLPPHFENDNSHVQRLSIELFCMVMDLVVEEGENPLTTIVRSSAASCPGAWRAPAAPGRGTGTRLPCPSLRCHLRLSAALQASGEALLCAARFLKRRDLEELLLKKQRMKFAERLLLQDESRAAEHLRWALPYLQSPQRPVRRAAVRIMGLAGVLVTGQKEELQVLTEALQALRGDERPSCMSIVLQLMFERRSAGLGSSAGSDVPASFGDCQFPLKMGAPAEQDGPAGAPGTALTAQS